MQEPFADAQKSVTQWILLVLGLTERLLKSWAQLRVWAVDGMCYRTKISRAVQSRALGRGMEGKENCSSAHNDKKCLALTFSLPTASSKLLAVVNEIKGKKWRRPSLSHFSRLTLLRRSRVSFSFCWYSRSFLYLQTEQRRWSSMVHPFANCTVICTITHNIHFMLKQNMNLERAQKISLCFSINFFLVWDDESNFRID